jgi:hypothetical protein
VFFFAAGAGLLVYKQYLNYYEEKTANDLDEAVNLSVQKPSAPTVLADGRLQVDSPKEESTVGQTFTISGYAQGWFEGNIAIKVFDASNTPLYIGNAIAGDNYTRPAPFSSTITLSATSTTPTGRIELNDYSAKDGSLVYQKVVNIKFSSVSSPEAGGGDISGWKTYKNDQYGFEFEYPATWEILPLNDYSSYYTDNPFLEVFAGTVSEAPCQSYGCPVPPGDRKELSKGDTTDLTDFPLSPWFKILLVQGNKWVWVKMINSPYHCASTADCQRFPFEQARKLSGIEFKDYNNFVDLAATFKFTK